MSPTTDVPGVQSAHDATMVAPTRLLRASWSSTLRLPKSSFPPRPSPASTAEYLRRCTDELYAWQQNSRSKADADGKPPETFTLHDGPPYANGPLHIGHALNKITKDIICRFQVGQGRKVSYIPGWDCHGLPIEIKALQAQKKDHADTDPVSVREAARELAARTVEEQKRGFKEWAVMGDWNSAYKTMEKEFEIRQLEVFKKMFEKGLIYRQNKPVYWSPSSRTALAEAELEYDENHRSLAAFVRFPVEVSEELRNGALSKVSGPLNIVIWTTTPWTLPANKAVAVHKDMEYCVVRDSEKGGEMTLVAASRLAEYQKVLERELTIVLSGLRGADLAGNLQYENPFQKANGLQSVIHADFVTDSSGTGLVHLAPGHGMDDYHVCCALGFQAFAPIDDAGAFTKDAFPERSELLEGLPVSDVKKTGSIAILNYLEKQDMLRGKQHYRHKYPIDWRTKQPVIVRATEQWFANVDGIKEGAMKAIAPVNFMPESGRHRLESFIQGRSQWCISRQRAWGVPIPALYRVTDEGNHEAIMDSETIQHIIEVIKERGSNAWWTDAQDDPAWVPKRLSGSYIRGKDTMDVWFDSGTSWTLLPGKEDQPVADVYLEGTDQHRGWFQSSLLTHVATQSFETDEVKAPYKTLITHGFTLDAEGRKMSKSLGNVISPSQITSGELLPPIKRKKQKGAKQEQPKDTAPTYDAMGSDALRLWVASSDYLRDVTIGQPVLMSVNQALHKYRVTFKWLLGVLSLPSCPPVFDSFNNVRAELSADRSSLKLLADKLALHRLTQMSQEVHGYYTKYEFFKGVNMINKYISIDLSAFYFETLKDRIYTGHKAECQHLQNMLGLIFYELLQMLAPICPLLVEEVWDHVPEALKEGSVHPARAAWSPLPLADKKTAGQLDMAQYNVDTIGTAIKAAQERLRAAKKMGSSLECAVTVFRHETNYFGSLDMVQPEDRENEFASLFVVSGFKEVYYGPHPDMEAAEMEDTTQYKEVTKDWWEREEFEIDEDFAFGGTVVVHRPHLEKCPRCWRFQREKERELCGRCEDVVKEEEL
ncbi:isoleucyl-tRNA synthetase-like protein [Trematosphaeria pertusa]|uniref:Isoleucine--tRNA ligase, mitochondrial n=1 Tax=Trematosphaeria pertusa TaxID=390896 RepID=A0A6A6IZK5_9PLEO|nr:isoleucyl-tRNA synthetase-like protein [Trematosphaeria pertusa]KAF2255020.1 isoleucyl-tRNA synthetase-like protein [Trematosphaeria pertusa]